jgi:voltage-gated sodium channel
VNFITLTILAAGVVVGIQTEMDASTPLLDVMDILILSVFTFEVIVKVMAEGDEPLRYFNDNWNCFDFFIVFACFIFMLPFMPDVGSMLAMLRLLRLLRVLKLVKALPQV